MTNDSILLKTVGIYANPDKPDSVRLVRLCAQFLQEKGVTPVLLFRQLDSPELSSLTALPKDSFFRNSDAIVVLGGDGTLLSVARLGAEYEAPLFGINAGKLGFLTEGENHDYKELLTDLIEGKTRIDDRVMLSCHAVIGKHREEHALALNDIVIKNTAMRLMMMRIHAGEHILGNYRADGVIVATPTGSTAYSLAAGGPIVHPDADILIVNPLCPQQLYDRPFILPSSVSLTIDFEHSERSIIVTMDGQKSFYLNGSDSLVIERSPYTAKLLRLTNSSYYERIRKKLFNENCSHSGENK